MKNYTTVIDLTSRATASDQPDDSFLKEPDPALPPISISDLSKGLQNAVTSAGWEELMPVQSMAIPYMLQGRDLIVQSRTGSGKTGAFLLPLFDLIDPAIPAVQALVLVPTRELARQVHEAFQELCSSQPEHSGHTSVAVYGGVGYKHQIKAFRSGVDLVVGTPGRILDHLEQGNLSLKRLKLLILDEADEMLSMGFMPDMIQLRRHVPRERASYMFSATIPYKVRQLGRDFLNEPGFLSLSEGKVHVDTMAHRFFLVGPMEKDAILRRLLELHNPDSAIIFSNTKKKVEYLAMMLRNYGFSAEPISGDIPQAVREQVMADLRAGKIRLLVATDVAARGIDISDLTHVFMYDIPQDPEYYIHRAGRTARAGKTGMALTLATALDQSVLKAIVKRYEIDMERREPPTDDDVRKRIEERAVLLLEDEWRLRSKDEKELYTSLVDVVRAFWQDGHGAWLAMLIDAFYHKKVHIGGNDLAANRPPSSRDDLSPEQLAPRLEEAIRKKSVLRRSRIERFEKLVDHIVRIEESEDQGEGGEPELLAMLLTDFSEGRLLVEPAPEKKSVEPSRSQKGKRHSGRGAGRRNSSTSRRPRR